MKNVVAILVLFFYVIFSYFILAPQNLNYFSLIDDGQSIQNSHYFNECFQKFSCDNLKKVLIEKEFGRFRPVYWSTQYFLYQVLGFNSTLHHVFRVYFTGSILLVLLLYSVFQTSSKYWGGVIATLIFVGSYSFTENILRLGPQEPYQLITIALFSILYLNKERYHPQKKFNFYYLISISLITVISILVKETSIILIVPPILISIFKSSKKEYSVKLSVILAILGLLVFSIGRIIARPISGELAYTENFGIDINRIFQNFDIYLNIILNNTSPFLKISLLLFISMMLLGKVKKTFFSEKILYWFLLSILSFCIILPWKFTLERYILVTLYSISILIGAFWNYFLTVILKKVSVNSFKRTAIIVNFMVLVLILNIFFISYPVNLAKTLNYTTWYRTFLKYENDQITYLAKISNEEVYINALDNLNNWEILYEIPIHLKYLFSVEKFPKLLKNDLPKSGYVFTRIPFDLGVEKEKLESYSVLESQTYEVKQIDPIEFKNQFAFRPLSSITRPPYLLETYNYYWEVRKL